MHRKRIPRIFGGVAIVAVVGASVAAFVLRDRWLPRPEADTAEADDNGAPVEDAKVLKLSPQARKNLALISKPAKPQAYWRTIQVPGVVVDRPGLSDRGVTSPAVGVVTQVHAFAGDTVRPGEILFSLRLFSEYLQNTQSDLLKATRETELIK